MPKTNTISHSRTVANCAMQPVHHVQTPTHAQDVRITCTYTPINASILNQLIHPICSTTTTMLGVNIVQTVATNVMTYQLLTGVLNVVNGVQMTYVSTIIRI